ncbi:class I SAM-dependent methyltransferase [Actinotalea fermentans]|uniref:class I SAM-dependent methyltransferase n=1 Tax=Actinotalea fermentans TaxID=43671 RepID=UPI00051F42BF|nr:methyltransferase [Actinotalea fermentans]KGM15767.1 SAM-dependent methyltransferase [Actinotalea fermentans ATCC 43279 = JCM 9966 = DSM 3133]
MTTFSFDDLRRFPDVEAVNLVAADATDRLILDEAAADLATAPAGTVCVVGDRYGALTLGAVALHGVTGVRTHQDRLVGEQALTANAERLGLSGTFTTHLLDDGALAGARVVLWQLPASLDELDEVAEAIATHAHPEVRVYAGGRVKHMTHGMNDVLGRWFSDVQARLARQKSRVLVAAAPRPAGDRPAPDWPAAERHDDLGLTVLAHGGVFAGTGVDIGTRFLLASEDQMAPAAETALDLGCGTGVLAVSLAQARPALRVTATDESAAAVASARATAEANGVADRVTVARDVAAAGVPDASVDLVVLNPPFHVGTTVHSGIARRLFADAARVLRPGGELWVVWNSHLQYRPVLTTLVGPTRQADRNAKFTVTVSTKAVSTKAVSTKA